MANDQIKIEKIRAHEAALKAKLTQFFDQLIEEGQKLTTSTKS